MRRRSRIDIPDAPWIRETEQTGYCSSGWWNNPPKDTAADEEQKYCHECVHFGRRDILNHTGICSKRKEGRYAYDFVCDCFIEEYPMERSNTEMKELTLEYTLEVTEIVKIPDEEEFSPVFYDKKAMSEIVRDNAKSRLGADDVLVKKYKIFETGNHEAGFDD